MRSFVSLSLVVTVLFASGNTRGESKIASIPNTIQFNRDIRTILSDNCFQCHGPDKDKRKAKLRLDTREGLLGEIDGRHTVLPGKPDQSELYRRITATDPDDRMPQSKSGKTLSKSQIELIKRWIEQGAPWQGHWAYLAPTRPALPSVKKQSWPKNPIDDFILARLDKEGLRPSSEADKRTLIRRLSFDLTGLPPTLEAVNDFVADRHPQAYERLVDRLLASPHYGERMAMYWLDLVRYADTDGFHSDNYRSVYPYRDYVINAFNDNLPFDRFTVEQIAGDLLPNPPRAATPQKIASTYNRLNRTTEEGGAQPKEYLAKYSADRVRTTSTTWLGATMGCAECHDHKFDPITTKDFYSFAAFFADIKEQGVAKPEPVLLPNEQQAIELKPFDEQVAQWEKQYEAATNQFVAVQASWEQKLLADLDAGLLAWAPVKPENVVSEKNATLTIQEDLSVLASGENPTNDNYSVLLETDRTHITAIRLEALTDPTLDKQSLSRGGGNFVLTGFEVEVVIGGDATNKPVKIASAIADYSQKDYPISAAIDDKPDTGWAVDGETKVENRKAAFVFAQPIPGGPGTTLTIRMRHESKQPRHNIGRFRLALSSVNKPKLTKDGLSTEIIEILRTVKGERSKNQEETLQKHYLESAYELDPIRDELTAAKKKRDEFTKDMPATLVTVSVEPRVMRILPRGNWMSDSGEIVTPSVPEFLPHPASNEKRATRLDLARWLISRDNPLTARVFVNRLWRLYFGAGLAKTLDDFGSRGEWPKHPELLDWLAVEFMDSGWDIRHMVKLMVMSNTYRQSSIADERVRERDPANRLFGRQTGFRLDAEMVRDNALAVSGMLTEKIGGPSVKPYQPAGYWDHLNFPKRTWQNDHGAATYRRGLYTFWCRTFLQPACWRSTLLVGGVHRRTGQFQYTAPGAGSAQRPHVRRGRPRFRRTDRSPRAERARPIG